MNPKLLYSKELDNVSGGKIGISLFGQGFFYGVYAGGAEYVLQSCFVGNTGYMK
jgi:hypothetical protein